MSLGGPSATPTTPEAAATAGAGSCAAAWRAAFRLPAVLSLLSLLLVLTLLVPWTPRPFSATLGGPGEPTFTVDTSYVAALHQSFVERVDFATRPFTFGPWGFLYGGYHPATYRWQVGAWIFLAAAFWIGASHAVRECVSRPWLRGPVVSSLAILACSADSPDCRFYLLLALLLACYFYTPRQEGGAATATLAVAAALTGLIKFSFLIAGLGIVLCISADECARRRTWPKHLLAYGCGLAAFWLLARQPIASFGPFLRNSSALAGGYGAMSLTPDYASADVALFLVVAGLLLARAGRAAWQRRRRWGALAVSAFAFLLFVVFKSGHVRHDPAHHVQATFPLLFLSVLLALQLWRHEDGQWRILAGMTVAVAGAGVSVDLARSNDYDYGLAEAVWRALVTVPRNAQSVASAASGDDFISRRFNREMDNVRATCPIPPATGSAHVSVDIYPSDILVVLANRLRWRPRPVIQSYTAYTPALAALNAEHLRSAAAADRVLFRVAPIDGRFPSLEDGLSWPELWTRYNGATTISGYLLLERSNRPRAYTIEPLGDVVTTFGRPVRVPNTGAREAWRAVWASVEVNPSLAGRVADAAYKAPATYLRALMADGGRSSGRMPPGMARGGFLLSPMISDASAFAAFMSPGWQGPLNDRRVAEIVIATESPADASRYFDPNVVVHFSAIDFPRR